MGGGAGGWNVAHRLIRMTSAMVRTVAMMLAVTVTTLAIILGVALWALEPPASPPIRLEHEITAEISPDRAHVVDVLRRDNGVGFGLGAEFVVVRLAETRPGATPIDLVVFEPDNVDHLAIRLEWRDAAHAVVGITPSKAAAPEVRSAFGVTVEVRR